MEKPFVLSFICVDPCVVVWTKVQEYFFFYSLANKPKTFEKAVTNVTCACSSTASFFHTREIFAGLSQRTQCVYWRVCERVCVWEREWVSVCHVYVWRRESVCVAISQCFGVCERVCVSVFFEWVNVCVCVCVHLIQCMAFSLDPSSLSNTLSPSPFKNIFSAITGEELRRICFP